MMTWLALIFALECGIAPQIGVLQYEPREALVSDWEIGYAQLEAEVELFGILFAGGGVRTYITPHGGITNWSPNTSVYDWRLGARWKWLELGWRHRCFHPTVPYLPSLNQEITGLEGSYDELYFRLEGRIGGRP